MSDRSRSPPPKSRKLVNAIPENLPDDSIVNGKITGDDARDIIDKHSLKHCNRIAINNKLFYLNKDGDLVETNIAFGKTKKKKKRKKVLKTRRKKKRGKKIKKK